MYMYIHTLIHTYTYSHPHIHRICMLQITSGGGVKTPAIPANKRPANTRGANKRGAHTRLTHKRGAHEQYANTREFRHQRGFRRANKRPAKTRGPSAGSVCRRPVFHTLLHILKSQHNAKLTISDEYRGDFPECLSFCVDF